MCLAIPGKVVDISEDKRSASVDFGGVRHSVRLDLLPSVDESLVGKYVLVHVGYAIERISEEEGEETLRVLKEYMNAMEEALRSR